VFDAGICADLSGLGGFLCAPPLLADPGGDLNPFVVA
jgi:hypothetical protein